MESKGLVNRSLTRQLNQILQARGVGAAEQELKEVEPALWEYLQMVKLSLTRSLQSAGLNDRQIDAIRDQI